MSQRGALILAAVAGSGAFALLAWPPSSAKGFVAYVFLAAGVHCVGLVAPLRLQSGAYPALAVWMAGTLGMAGGAAAGVRAAELHWAAGFGVVVLAAITTSCLPLLFTRGGRLHEEEQGWFDLHFGYARLAFATVAALTYAGWLGGHQSDRPAAGLIVFLVVGSAINAGQWIVGGRFKDLIAAEKTIDEGPQAAAALDRFAPVIWTQFIAFLLSTFIGLTALLVALAVPERLDVAATGDPEHAVVVVVLLGVAVLLSGAAYVRSRRVAPWPAAAMRDKPTVLRTDPLAAALLLAALAVASIAPLVFLPELRGFEPEVLIFALALGVYVAEYVFADGAWLQLADFNYGAGIVVLLSVTAFASPVVWLLGSGLWSGDSPARTAVAAPLALGVLCLTAAIPAFAGSMLGWSSKRLLRTLHRPGQNAVQDSVVAAVLVLLGGVIPVYVGARTDDGSAVTVAVHLAVLVALIIGLVIAVRNDIEHARREHGRQVILEERFAHPVGSAGAVDDDGRSRELEPAMEKERVRRVELRIRRWQVPAGIAILLTSASWLLAHLT